jgi:hypothetical protein
MRNRHILHVRQEAEIYKAYYQPSFNLGRFFKSILGVIIFGSGPVSQNYEPGKKKILK